MKTRKTPSHSKPTCAIDGKQTAARIKDPTNTDTAPNTNTNTDGCEFDWKEEPAGYIPNRKGIETIQIQAQRVSKESHAQPTLHVDPENNNEERFMAVRVKKNNERAAGDAPISRFKFKNSKENPEASVSVAIPCSNIKPLIRNHEPDYQIAQKGKSEVKIRVGIGTIQKSSLVLTLALTLTLPLNRIGTIYKGSTPRSLKKDTDKAKTTPRVPPTPADLDSYLERGVAGDGLTGVAGDGLTGMVGQSGGDKSPNQDIPDQKKKLHVRPPANPATRPVAPTRNTGQERKNRTLIDEAPIRGNTPRFSGNTPRVSGSTPRVSGSTPRVSGSTPRVSGSTPRVSRSTPRVRVPVKKARDVTIDTTVKTSTVARHAFGRGK